MTRTIARLLFSVLLTIPSANAETKFVKKTPLDFTISRTMEFAVDMGADSLKSGYEAPAFSAHPTSKKVLMNMRKGMIVADFSTSEVLTRRLEYRNGQWRGDDIECVDSDGIAKLLKAGDYSAVPDLEKESLHLLLKGEVKHGFGQDQRIEQDSFLLPFRKLVIFWGGNMLRPSECFIGKERLKIKPDADEHIGMLYHEPINEVVLAWTEKHLVFTDTKSKEQIIVSGPATIDGEKYSLHLTPIPYSSFFIASCTPYVPEEQYYDGAPTCFITDLKGNILSNRETVPNEIAASKDYFIMLSSSGQLDNSCHFALYSINVTRETDQ